MYMEGQLTCLEISFHENIALCQTYPLPYTWVRT